MLQGVVGELVSGGPRRSWTGYTTQKIEGEQNSPSGTYVRRVWAQSIFFREWTCRRAKGRPAGWMDGWLSEERLFGVRRQCQCRFVQRASKEYTHHVRLSKRYSTPPNVRAHSTQRLEGHPVVIRSNCAHLLNPGFLLSSPKCVSLAAVVPYVSKGGGFEVTVVVLLGARG